MIRRLVTSAVVVPVALLLVAPTDAFAAPVAVPSVITLGAPASVAAEVAFPVRGAVVDTEGDPVAATEVVVRARTAGRTKWHRLGVVTTTKKGKWTFTTSATFNTEVQAFAVDASGAKVLSPVAPVNIRQSLAVSAVTPSRPAVGQVLTVRGTTSTALRDTTLSLQRRLSTGWTTLEQTRVDQAGRYEVGVRVADASALNLRVRSGARKSITRVISSSTIIYPTVTATLPAGGKLTARRQLTSVNGAYAAIMQPSGALEVKSSAGAVLWSSATVARNGYARLRDDGNLVIMKGEKQVWQSGTAGVKAALVLQNDGSLVVFRNGKALWSSTKGLGKKVLPAECWSTTFDCISFSGYVPSTRYWAMYSGHNCTNYVAYRLGLQGVTTPPWGLPGGSAWEWRAHAKAKKIKVDRTPTVGSVMQWNRNTLGGGSSGHVVYVEKVTDTAVLISEDSWSSHAAVRTIRRDSPVFASARFLHIRDA